MVEQVGATERQGPRKASRDVRRRQLIEATIDVLAARGYASLTIGDVARKAGLSMGIINFHFSSKETLLAETLRYLARGYRENWMSAVEAAGADPAARLYAMTTAGSAASGATFCARIVESGRTDVEVVAINDLGPVETNAHLMRYDSVMARQLMGPRHGDRRSATPSMSAAARSR
jgi:AcrR family transcriptional regulator